LLLNIEKNNALHNTGVNLTQIKANFGTHCPTETKCATKQN